MALDPAIASAFTRIAPGALEKIASALSRPVDAMRVRIQNVFGDHVRFTVDRCSYVKTIVADEMPVSLRDIYVGLTLKHRNGTVNDYHLANSKRTHNTCLIRGTAGAGKTMLMKFLALETFANADRLPIFIDLRDIGNPGSESFLRSIFRLCTPENSSRDYDLFHAGMRAGLFSFFFDGLDEVNPNYRETTFRQIQRFPFDFPDVQVTISTRPETEVSGFSIYQMYELNALSNDQAVELIHKTDFHDPAKKAAFIEKLNDGLYTDRLSFASNPLLCLLMLMTFSHAGEIPHRAAVFYDHAFETLYSRHDASKGPFRRIHRTGLGKREFRRLFGLFCYRTLANHYITFDEIDLRNELQRAIELAGERCDADDLMKDCLESVCLIQRDGGKLHFIHRSFQEFFAADFLAHYRGENIYAVFDRILSDTLASKVAPLLYDLAPSLIEEVWIEKVVDRAICILERGTPEPATAYLSQFISKITVPIETGEVASAEWITGQELGQVVQTIQLIYPDLGLPEQGLSLIGRRAYPPKYRSFRRFLSKSETVPQDVQRRLRKETLAIAKANRERKSMSQMHIRGFEIDLSEREIEAWIDSTPIVQIFPSVLGKLKQLKETISGRMSHRKQLDILS